MDLQLLAQTQTERLASFLAPSRQEIPRSALTGMRLGAEVSVITGVRRCGKSYAMRLLAQELRSEAAIYFLDLEDPRLIHFQAEDFERSHDLWLAAQASVPQRVVMFFDEPHLIPGWERWMTHFASRAGYSVILTGSNSRMLSSDLATFLTGRHRVVEFSPLSFSELSRASEPDPDHLDPLARRSALMQLFEGYLTHGGFPRVWLDKDQALLSQYFRDIVEKDISARSGAAPARVNLELGVTLMTNAARRTNKSKLAKQLGFKQARTITKHIGGFIDSYLLFEVRLFSPAIKVQQRSLPKFYPVDHALARSVRFNVLDDRSLALECMVAVELRRRGYELFYWLSEAGWEVDFIARKMGADLLAVQVCLDISAPETVDRETRALGACVAELGVKNLLLVTGNERRELSAHGLPIITLPFWEWAGPSKKVSNT